MYVYSVTPLSLLWFFLCVYEYCHLHQSYRFFSMQSIVSTIIAKHPRDACKPTQVCGRLYAQILEHRGVGWGRLIKKHHHISSLHTHACRYQNRYNRRKRSSLVPWGILKNSRSIIVSFPCLVRHAFHGHAKAWHAKKQSRMNVTHTVCTAG